MCREAEPLYPSWTAYDFSENFVQKLYFLKFFFSFIALYLIYNFLLIPGVEQSDSIIHMHVFIFFMFFFHIGYYRILSRVLCVIQRSLLVSYLYAVVCVC